MSNLQIYDKVTGKTEPFQNNGIDLCKQSPESIKRLLSGKKIEISSQGISKYVNLCKTSLGWGLTIGKQKQSATDSSATL